MTTSDWNEIVAGYERMLGAVPGHVGLKQLLHPTGSEEEQKILSIEVARADALESDALPPETVQLLQFVMCAVLRLGDGARVHAAAAQHHGVTVEELLAAARVTWVVAGNMALNTALAGIAAAAGES